MDLKEVETRLAAVEAALTRLGVSVSRSLENVSHRPELTCINNGVIVEYILRDLWRRLGIKGSPESKELNDLRIITTRKLEEQGSPMPRRIQDYITEVAIPRNRASHWMDATPEDALGSLWKLSEIARWYFVTFLPSREKTGPGSVVSTETRSESGPAGRTSGLAVPPSITRDVVQAPAPVASKQAEHPADDTEQALPESATISFIPLDVPGAHRVEAMDINDAGQITGNFVLDGRHGFLRLDAETYINLDVPDRHGNAWQVCGYGINDAGQIVGSVYAAGNESGVLRFVDGLFQPIGVPGATSSVARGINAAGEIVGWFADAAGNQHGYLRTATGTFTTIDVPGATSTMATGINAAGEIVGNFIVAGSTQGSTQHGFVRSALGTFTTIDVPGATWTQAWGINGAKQIVGAFYARGRFHGFLRAATGAFATIDPPGATTSECYGINGAGQIVGSFEDASKKSHGFVTAS